MAKVVKSNEFAEEVKEGLVVVDFYADWCGPCKMLGPVFQELSEEMEGQVKFVKVNVDDSRDLASKFKITNIPAMVILKDGAQQDIMVGFSPKAVIREQVEKYL